MIQKLLFPPGFPVLGKEDRPAALDAAAGTPNPTPSTDLDQGQIANFLDPDHKEESLELIKQQLQSYRPTSSGQLQHGRHGQEGAVQKNGYTGINGLAEFFTKLALWGVDLDGLDLIKTRGGLPLNIDKAAQALASDNDQTSQDGKTDRIWIFESATAAAILLDLTNMSDRQNNIMKQFLKTQIFPSAGGDFAEDAPGQVYQAIKNIRTLVDLVPTKPKLDPALAAQHQRFLRAIALRRHSELAQDGAPLEEPRRTDWVAPQGPFEERGYASQTGGIIY